MELRSCPQAFRASSRTPPVTTHALTPSALATAAAYATAPPCGSRVARQHRVPHRSTPGAEACIAVQRASSIRIMLTSARLPSTRSTVTLPTSSSCGLRCVHHESFSTFCNMLAASSAAPNTTSAVQGKRRHASKTPTETAHWPQPWRPPTRS